MQNIAVAEDLVLPQVESAVADVPARTDVSRADLLLSGNSAQALLDSLASRGQGDVSSLQDLHASLERR